MLEISGLEARYGPTQVLRGVDLSLEAGGALAVLGRNGAGKTTLLKAIAGLVPATAGSIVLDGEEEITNLPAHERARVGVGYAPQGRRLFGRLTVLENIRMGFTVRDRGKLDEELIAAIYDAFPVLNERRDQKAASLSGGEQQMVAFARAIATHPRLLLLDEPSEGLGPIIVDALVDSVLELGRGLGFAILIVEQRVQVAFDVAEDVAVLERGEVVRRLTRSELESSADLERLLAF